MISFNYLVLANKLIKNTRPFNKNAFLSLTNSLLNQFSINTTPHILSEHPTPIFIVGIPRSGTTLTEQILASHSKVICTDELPFIERIAMQICKGKSYVEGISNLSEPQRKRFADYYLEQVREYIGDHQGMFIDKNPANFLHIGLILKLFPHAKIIALMRDPLDNGMSVYKQHFSHGNDFSYDLGDIITYIGGYFTLIAKWKALFEQSIQLLEYEKLVSDPVTTIKDLLTFCGLQFEPKCLSFHTSERLVLTPSVSQVRQPIHAKAVNSGNVYKNFIPEFLNDFEKLKKLKSNLVFHGMT